MVSAKFHKLFHSRIAGRFCRHIHDLDTDRTTEKRPSFPGNYLENIRLVQHFCDKVIAAAQLQCIAHQRTLQRGTGTRRKEAADGWTQFFPYISAQFRPESNRCFTGLRYRNRTPLFRRCIRIIRHGRSFIIVVFLYVHALCFGDRYGCYKTAALDLLFQPGQAGIQCLGIQRQLRLADRVKPDKVVWIRLIIRTSSLLDSCLVSSRVS